MTVTPEVNMIIRQMNPSLLRALSVGIFHFCILIPSKFNFMGSPSPALCYGL